MRRSAGFGPWPAARSTKIIAVTASAMDENRQELMEIGADDFISKPFREAELFQKIHTHVGVEYLYAEVTAAPPEAVAAHARVAGVLAAV